MQVQKGSIDEFYVDATEEAWKRTLTGTVVSFVGHQIQTTPLLPEDDFDLALYAASRICQELRDTIFSQLSFTTSAGIASNKMLAKIASNFKKPNEQTIILPRQVDALLSLLPLEKLPQFWSHVHKRNWEIVDRLKTLHSVRTAFDLTSLSHAALEKHFEPKVSAWIALL